jgi:radical SAM superfamily enzyme YgiQ (UPF0313 family)
VDLNNFSVYPTPPIGILAAVLRRAGHEVDVFSPLAVGVGGMTRERMPGRWSLPAALLNDRIARSRAAWLRATRARVAEWMGRPILRQQDVVVDGFGAALSAHKPDIVLISTYLSFRDVCARLCRIAQQAGVPMLVGGPYFAQRSVIDAWLDMPGLSALISGEVELQLPAIVEAVCEGTSLAAEPGVHVPGSCERGSLARPLTALDEVPYPDYGDFRWPTERPRIAPVITGRGCAWGACSFCSDVTSTAGRRWRSRSVDNVLGELAHHRDRHGVRHFVFTDLKLNGDLAVWRALAGRMQDIVPDARWVGAVHVGREVDNGLGRADLEAAARSGCVRLTTGLETGSQRLADLMRKGTSIERIGRFLDDAAAAGISPRCTMILGYPGETTEDVEQSVAFLQTHAASIERVSLNRLQVIAGTVLDRGLRMHAGRFGQVAVLGRDEAQATVETMDLAHRDRRYRRASDRLIAQVQAINRRPLSGRAQDFDGVM